METQVDRNLEFPHRVRLTWERNHKWNLICAWALEHFGLPGDRFMTGPTENFMDWYFRSQDDKILFVIAWGDDNEF